MSIHFCLQRKYYPLGEPVRKEDQKGSVPAQGPLYEYLCNKLICRAGSKESSWKLYVWLEILVPENW